MPIINNPASDIKGRDKSCPKFHYSVKATSIWTRGMHLRSWCSRHTTDNCDDDDVTAKTIRALLRVHTSAKTKMTA